MKNTAPPRTNLSGLISPSGFLRSTRDAGYRSAASALAELVDNALNAEGRTVAIRIGPRKHAGSLRVSVLDDGIGMTPNILQRALQFGGTTYCRSFSSLGRFGMGLPAGSLCQARAVTVYTWRRPTTIHAITLDIDLVSGTGGLGGLSRASYPDGPTPHSHSTLVVWDHCDRVTDSNPQFIERIAAELGCRFRKFILLGYG